MPRRTLEKDLRQAIVDAARLLGYKVYFTWRSDHSPAGFPDLCLVKGDRLIFAELKTERGKVTPDQDAWLRALESVPGIEVYLWRPENLDAALELLAA